MRSMSPGIESARNGSWPVNNWNSDTASANRSERPVDGAALQLLGRHERRRAEHHAGARAAGVGQAGNAEIRDLQFSTRRVEHDVGRLDVAVHDLVLVRIVQRIGEPRHDFNRNGRRASIASGSVYSTR